jgi:hypothetical protein
MTEFVECRHKGLPSDQTALIPVSALPYSPGWTPVHAEDRKRVGDTPSSDKPAASPRKRSA